MTVRVWLEKGRKVRRRMIQERKFESMCMVEALVATSLLQ
jgi:hypothetical protein